jgi:hypothetical protein
MIPDHSPRGKECCPNTRFRADTEKRRPLKSNSICRELNAVAAALLQGAVHHPEDFNAHR